jgi:phospholipid N-methyltransferase
MNDEPVKFSVAQINDFVNIYAKEYYEHWKAENLLNVSDSSEPVLEVLQKCVVDGMIVRLPPVQLERSLYMEVKDKLEKIGGKWKGGKIAGFVFKNDPAELLAQVAAGAKRNLKKEFQFFETPDKVADQLVELAEIEDGHLILEPSAGNGKLIHAIQRKHFANNIEVCELNSDHWKELQAIPGVSFLMDDFMGMGEVHYNFYDRIIANPPFSNNQDIDHIKQMWLMLKPGGKLVSVASKSFTFSSKKKQTEFREWLEEYDADIIPIEGGAFKESGTMIETVIISFWKPRTAK